MLKPENVPEEVWSAFHEAVLRYGYKPQAIAAALNAWPGMSQLEENDSASIREMAALILPLPQEASDE
jgi:hypothetical protein